MAAGYSVFHTRPRYQNTVVARDQRAVPDVSMLADVAPGYAIYCTAHTFDCPSAGWNQIGGTSAAAPLLASGLVLVDQDLTRGSRELVGFADPLLYRLGGSSEAASVFSDVTEYSNDVGTTFGDGQPLGCCAARVGFDEASGWGSVNGWVRCRRAEPPAAGSEGLAVGAPQPEAGAGQQGHGHGQLQPRVVTSERSWRSRSRRVASSR